ncbi:MucBP domain-containing protein, partial [Enterococcus faecalis]|nr:MucBP domain-containing protein [Enterococcus faecalis]EKZ0222032.1 MucBP domain-containing protein [Enterococcus faecalis]
MKKSKFLGLIMSFALIWPFMFSNNVQAANGWPEAYYNGSMSRWEFDISQSPLYENTQGMYEGTQDMVYLGNLQSSPYWEQDPSAKNMFYTSKPFNPGAGSYNTITIQYPSDNGVWWRHIYLDYIGPVEVKYLEVGTNNVLAPVNYVAGKGGDTFNIQSQQIPGYQLDHVEGTESGTFKSVGPGGYYEHTTNLRLSGMVRYYYKKIAVGADVTVKYVDESGNEVSTTETLSGNVGEAYTSTQKTISGYTFKE